MPILIESEKLRFRNKEIKKLMDPMARGQVSSKTTYLQKGVVLFAAFGGKNPISTNHRDWFFNTNKKGFNASYFEIWSENGKDYSLEKAYFTLMENVDNTNRELLALHIDPMENVYPYKNGPHMHVKTANSVISKAHISLNLSNLNQVVNSYDVFKMAYRDALKMINSEVINNLI